MGLLHHSWQHWWCCLFQPPIPIHTQNYQSSSRAVSCELQCAPLSANQIVSCCSMLWQTEEWTSSLNNILSIDSQYNHNPQFQFQMDWHLEEWWWGRLGRFSWMDCLPMLQCWSIDGQDPAGMGSGKASRSSAPCSTAAYPCTQYNSPATLLPMKSPCLDFWQYPRLYQQQSHISQLCIYSAVIYIHPTCNLPQMHCSL